MPINDSFSAATYIYDGAVIHSDNVGASTEAGEPGLPYATVWYKWTASRTQTASVTVTGTGPQPAALCIWREGTTGTDTLSSIVQLAISANVSFNGATLTFTATVGMTYYFQIGSWTATSGGSFSLSYPKGRTAGIATAGTNDLPLTFTGRVVRPSGACEVVEAVGYGPESEKVTSSLTLLGRDFHSTSTFAPGNPLKRNSDNSPSYSCERWFRLRFSPPFGAITNLRMWVDNFTAPQGWSLYYGTTDTHTTPSIQGSTYAQFDVPTSDPGVPNLGVGILTGGQTRYSPWIVLQAAWLPNEAGPGPIQAAPLNWTFGWTEA